MSMPPRRILWFYSELDQSGGGERLCLEGGRCLKDHGVESCYAVYGDYDPRRAFEGRYQPRVFSMGGGRPGAFPTLSQFLWLRRLIRKVQPDLILTEGTWVHVAHVYLATLGTRFPYAAQVAASVFAAPPGSDRTKYARVFRNHLESIRNSVHGYRENARANELNRPSSLVKRVYNELHAFTKYLAVRKAAKLFVHSRQNRWEVRELYGRDAAILKGAFPERILSHVPKGDLRRRLTPEGRKVIFTLSRFSSHKRIDLTLRAFKLLKKRRPDAVLVIGGRSYPCDRFRVPEDGLASLGRELGVAGDVIFAGYIPEDDLWDAYASSDVFIHMDLADFDIAPYEALALGARVVWSSEMELDPDLREMGRVFPAAPTPEETARALELALEASGAPPDEAARAVLSRHTWERHFAQMLDQLGMPVRPYSPIRGEPEPVHPA